MKVLKQITIDVDLSDKVKKHGLNLSGFVNDALSKYFLQDTSGADIEELEQKYRQALDEQRIAVELKAQAEADALMVEHDKVVAELIDKLKNVRFRIRAEENIEEMKRLRHVEVCIMEQLIILGQEVGDDDEQASGDGIV